MILNIEVEVERTSGRFVSKDAIFEELAAQLDIGTVQVEDSEYDILNVNLV